jgi:hypothetical protein
MVSTLLVTTVSNVTGKKCFLFTHHSSLVVSWWVLVHPGLIFALFRDVKTSVGWFFLFFSNSRLVDSFEFFGRSHRLSISKN